MIEIHINKNKTSKNSETGKDKIDTKSTMSAGSEDNLVFTSKYYLNPIKKLLSRRKHNSELAEKPVFSPFSGSNVNSVNAVTGEVKSQQPTSMGIMGYLYVIRYLLKEINKSIKKRKRKKIINIFDKTTFSYYKGYSSGQQILIQITLKIRVK